MRVRTYSPHTSRNRLCPTKIPKQHKLVTKAWPNLFYIFPTRPKLNMVHLKLMVFPSSEYPIPGCHFQVNHVKLWESMKTSLHVKLWDGKSWKQPTNLNQTSIQPTQAPSLGFATPPWRRTWGGLGQPASTIFTVGVDHYDALVTSNTCKFGRYKLRGSNVQNAHWILKYFMWGPINYGKWTKISIWNFPGKSSTKL